MTHHTTTCQLTHQHHLPHPHHLRHLPYLKVAGLLSFLNAQSGSGLGAVGTEIPTARLHPWYLDLAPVPFLQLLLRIINQSYSVVSVFNQRQFLHPSLPLFSGPIPSPHWVLLLLLGIVLFYSTCLSAPSEPQVSAARFQRAEISSLLSHFFPWYCKTTYSFRCAFILLLLDFGEPCTIRTWFVARSSDNRDLDSLVLLLPGTSVTRSSP